MSHCILELKLKTTTWQADRLNHTFRCAERMYNIMVRHAIKQLAALRNNEEYQSLLSEYCELLKEQELTKERKKHKNVISKRLTEIVRSYNLSEYDFHAYIKKMKKESFEGVLDIDTAQKLASRVWQAVEKVLYSDGEKVHFKKRGALESLESKKNTSGIKFDKSTNLLSFKELTIPVKIRKKDTYVYEMLKKKICYCRIVRKPFKTRYKYFVQLVLEGCSVKIPELGKGDVGLDQGTSTVAAVGDHDAKLIAHGVADNKTFMDYNKEIIKFSRLLERSRRMNNPQNYNEDGTVKKDAKNWVRTKNYYRILFRLKDAYRRKAAFVKQLHNRHANQILKMGDNLITEPSNWKALQKRAKKTEKSDKEIVVTDKRGQSKKVKKNKKKKRFGKSLNNHSPGLFERTINQKLAYHNKTIHYVNLSTYRASQYNPETNEYKKCDLNDRTKTINNQLIQRDLLSAFELQNPNEDLKSINTNKVQEKLQNFIELHNKCVSELLDTPNMPSCMGLNNFK